MTTSRRGDSFRARVAVAVVSVSLVGAAISLGGPAGAGAGSSGATETVTPTPTATGSSPPTRTPAPTPDPIARTITLAASKAKVEVGETVTLSGTIQADDASCFASKSIQLQKQTLGTTGFVNAGVTSSDAEGAYTKGVPMQAGADFIAIAQSGAQDPCIQATSDAVRVQVKVSVTGTARPSTPPRKSEFHISGRVAPVHPGTKVVLQRRVDGRWKWAGSEKLGAKSDYDFTKKARWKGKRIFRVKWVKGDDDHLSGKSPRIKVKTTPPRQTRDR